MDLVHELCPVQLLEVTVTISRADWPAYSIWLICTLFKQGNILEVLKFSTSTVEFQEFEFYI